MNRRQLIQLGISAGAGTLLVERVSFAQGKDYYGGYKVGLQSYSLRTVPMIEKQIEIIGDLGVRYLETYNIPSNSSKERLEELKKMLKDRHIKHMAFGVVGIKNNEAQAREHFEFAKAMGSFAITADPDPDALDLLDKLCDEYKMNISIHPHGPRHRYPGWKAVQKLVDGHSKRIGLCLDTGHITRAGDDVVEGITTLKERVYGVHLKDLTELNDKGQDVPIGEGKMPVPGIFKALKEVKFKGIVSLEDECKVPDVQVTIKQSLEYLRKTLSA